MFRAPGESNQQGGASTFLYRSHPTKPNDALMAVDYAFMLGKILLGEAMIADISLKVALESSLLGGLNDICFPNFPGAISG